MKPKCLDMHAFFWQCYVREVEPRDTHSSCKITSCSRYYVDESAGRDLRDGAFVEFVWLCLCLCLQAPA